MDAPPPATVLPAADALLQDGAWVSGAYADVYHSRDGAEAESRHVFVDAQNLPARFAKARGSFVVAELGFGAGLNFLQTWRCWRQCAPPQACLHYLAWEARPLDHAQLRACHAGWPRLAALASRLRERLGPRWPGWHRLHVAPNVSLTLAYEDVAGLARADFAAHAWHLDGFAPDRNPQMWSAAALREVYRLSAPGASAAAYTAARSVRDHLVQAGFNVRRAPGFGRKRHMCVAAKPGTTEQPPPSLSAGVIGAGIAGASVAYALARRGVAVQVFEQARRAAGGASAVPLALLTPRASAGNWQRAALINQGFCFTRALCARKLGNPRRGALLLGAMPREAGRQARLAQLAWPVDMVVPVSAAAASDLAEVRLADGGLWMPQALQFAGSALARSMLGAAELHCGAQVRRIAKTAHGHWQVACAGGRTAQFAHLVIACGARATELLPAGSLANVHPGYMAEVAASTASRRLRVPLLSAGHLSCAGVHGTHLCSPSPSLAAAVGSWLDLRPAARCWAATRTSGPGRLPLAGPLDDGLYVLAGLGARGFAFGPLLGEQVAAHIAGEPPALPAAQLQLVAPRRARRGGQAGPVLSG